MCKLLCASSQKVRTLRKSHVLFQYQTQRYNGQLKGNLITFGYSLKFIKPKILLESRHRLQYLPMVRYKKNFQSKFFKKIIDSKIQPDLFDPSVLLFRISKSNTLNRYLETKISKLDMTHLKKGD